jgi:hypothetical protein
MRASLVPLLLGAFPLGGCASILGVQEHQLAPDGGGGSPDATGGGGMDTGVEGATPDGQGPGDGNGPSDSGGTQDASNDGPIIGDAGDAGVGDASDAAACPCSQGSLKCSGSTPQQCIACVWVNQTACTGSTPTCSNGLCGTYRTTGGIRSTAPAPPGDAGIRLVSGGFELGMRSCDEAGVCVTGGIVP